MEHGRFVKAEQGPNHSVIYTDEHGRFFRYTGGTWTWRNHNPGNVVPGQISKDNHAIGVAGKFAVFPDDESGHSALIDCLKKTFGNKSISFMIKQYAPKEENNTEKYEKFLRNKTGVKDEKKIKDFTAIEFESLWNAIVQMEGVRAGDIVEISEIIHVKKDKKQVICAYRLKNGEWIDKGVCVDLAKQGKLDVEVGLSRANNHFVRARPNSVIQKDLSKLVVKEA